MHNLIIQSYPVCLWTELSQINQRHDTTFHFHHLEEAITKKGQKNFFKLTCQKCNCLGEKPITF